jgi:hypothetical protein
MTDADTAAAEPANADYATAREVLLDAELTPGLAEVGRPVGRGRIVAAAAEAVVPQA